MNKITSAGNQGYRQYREVWDSELNCIVREALPPRQFSPGMSLFFRITKISFSAVFALIGIYLCVWLMQSMVQIAPDFLNSVTQLPTHLHQFVLNHPIISTYLGFNILFGFLLFAKIFDAMNSGFRG